MNGVYEMVGGAKSRIMIFVWDHCNKYIQLVFILGSKSKCVNYYVSSFFLAFIIARPHLLYQNCWAKKVVLMALIF